MNGFTRIRKHVDITMATIVVPILASFIILLWSTGVVIAQEMVALQPHARELLFTGFTRPVVKMTLAAEVSGKCRKMHVDKGDIVPEDGVVTEIDDTFVSLELAKNRIERQKTQRQLELEEKNLKRLTNLIQNNSTAQAIYDEALQNSQVLNLTLQGLQTERKRLEELLARHTLRAPEGWRVIERFIEPGEYVRQGEPILELGDFTTLVIPFMLTYAELELLRDMDKIVLFIPDLDMTRETEIFRVSPFFDEQKKKIEVELRTLKPSLGNSNDDRGGLRAQLKIFGKVENSTYQIPFSALINRYEARWVVGEDGTRHQVILLGKNPRGDRAIITGTTLVPGERIQASPTKFD